VQVRWVAVELELLLMESSSDGAMENNSFDLKGVNDLR